MKHVISGFLFTALLASQSWAQTLNVSVTANPFVTPGYSLDATTSGTVEYIISNTGGVGDHSINQFSLTFSGFNFNLLPANFIFNGATINGIAVTGLAISGNAISAGTGTFAPVINPGESMILSVDYTLQGPASTTVWSGGAPWRQDFEAGLVDALGNNEAFTNGVTAVTPEPGTFILLGSSLAGLGLFGAARRKKMQA